MDSASIFLTKFMFSKMSLRCIKKNDRISYQGKKYMLTKLINSVTVERYRIHSKTCSWRECPCHTPFGNTISALNGFPSDNHQAIKFGKEFHAKIELSFTAG